MITDILNVILKTSQRIYEQAKLTTANQARCCTLAERVSAIAHAAQHLQDKPNAAIYETTLKGLQACINECAELIQKNLLKPGKINAFLAFLKAENCDAAFNKATAKLITAQRDLNLAISAAVLTNQEQDRKDAAADQAKLSVIINLLETLTGNVAEVKELGVAANAKLADLSVAQRTAHAATVDHFASARERQKEVQRTLSSQEAMVHHFTDTIKRLEKIIDTQAKENAELRALIPRTTAVTTSQAVADIKSADAYFQEGQTYREASNYVAARQAYQKAAEQNHLKALNSLAILLLKGEGGSKNARLAHDYLYRAAMLGYERAMVTLAMQLYQGDGIPKDLAHALAWYDKAIDGATSKLATTLPSLERASLVSILTQAQNGKANIEKELAPAPSGLDHYKESEEASITATSTASNISSSSSFHLPTVPVGTTFAAAAVRAPEPVIATTSPSDQSGIYYLG